jgi:hypothetical protein
LRTSLPVPQTLAGIALLIAGVAWAVRTQRTPESAGAHPN